MSHLRNVLGQFLKGSHWRSHQIFREKEYLEREYITKGRSCPDIGLEHRVAGNSVLFWLRKHKIPRRTFSEARKLKYWRGPLVRAKRARPMTPEERSAYRQVIFLAFPERAEREHLRHQAWLKLHPGYSSSKIRNYRKSHPERYRSYDRVRQKSKTAYARERRRANPAFKIRCVLAGRINAALKGKNKSASTISLLGCPVASFRIYLESKFEEGMTWQNYGRYPGWQIDHIIPCAIFDLTKPEHQKRCFHFSNMQPLWAADNLSKSRKPSTNQFQLL